MENESMKQRLGRIDGYAYEAALRTTITKNCIEYIKETCRDADSEQLESILCVLDEYSKKTEDELNKLCEYTCIMRQTVR